MSWLRGLIEFLGWLPKLWRAYQEERRMKAVREALRREINREKAIQKSKEAKTDEEIMDSQKSIVDNSN